MQSVEFWGIPFRSAPHLHWFVMSIAFVGAHGLLLLIRALLRPHSGDTPGWFFVNFHLGTAAMAVGFTKFGTINGPVYSVDCIWFNTLMALVHLLIIHCSRR